jgi:uncharacterized damage-inducible protein DinB
MTTMPTATTATVPALSTAAGERADLLETLNQHRFFLRKTVSDLTDEQAALRSTVSRLCLGGLIKHVTAVESGWVDFIVGGPDALTEAKEWTAEETAERWAAKFAMLPGETLADLLERYDDVARHTDDLVATIGDLDASHPLPEAPWFEPGARWSARRALLHIIAETSQHAGHADIIRETIDGAKSMG